MADIPSGLPNPFDPSGYTHVQRGTEDPNETRQHPDAPAGKSMPPGQSRSPGMSRTFEAGKKLGKYELLAEIGEGGMGRVYKAHDPVLKRHVAIKMLRPNTNLDDVNRFRGEAALVAALEHPNIVQIFEIDSDPDGRPFLVLEYVDGGGLDGRLRQRLPRPREAAEWTETLALAVQAAHDKGIIHRDLKPANVLVTRTGTLKVSDFGLGKKLDETSGKTQTGDVFGTPGYMAPEQAGGKVKQFGPATDVYALGAMLYEFLTGRPPFTGAKVWEIIGQVQYADPVAPSVVVRGVPRDLNTICLKCLEKAPARRYQTAKELADDLRRYLDGLHIQASPVPWYGKLWRRAKRRPKETAIVGTMGAAVVAIGWLLVDARERGRITSLETKHNAERLAEQEKNREQLKSRNDKSLAALKEIRLAVLSEDLGQPKSQAKLKKHLADFFQDVVKSGEDVGDSEAALYRLAEECQTTGRLFGESGQPGQAAELYEQAAGLYGRAAEKVKDQPAAARDTFQQAICLREAGRHSIRSRQFDAAAEKLTAAGRLLDVDEDDLDPAALAQRKDALLAAAEVYHLKGELAARRDTPDEFSRADAEFTRAIRLLEQVPKAAQPRENVPLLKALALAYGWRGDARLQLLTNMENRADADYWESDRLRGELVQLLTSIPPEVLATEPDRLNKDDELAADAVYQLCNGWTNHANAALRKRMFGQARSFVEKQVKLLVQLTKLRPNRAEFRTGLAGRYLSRAEFELQVGDFNPTRSQADVAVQQADLAARIYQELKDAGSETPDTRMSWARCLLVKARAAVIRGESPAPLLAEAAEKLGEEKPGERMMDQYARAALHGLRAQSAADPAKHVQDAIKLLHTAVWVRGFRELHRETMRSDVAFRTVRSAPGFEEVFKKTYQKLEEK